MHCVIAPKMIGHPLFLLAALGSIDPVPRLFPAISEGLTECLWLSVETECDILACAQLSHWPN